MLKWINRYRVNKENNHVAWVDLYQDIETGVQYFGLGDSLSVRLNENGTPYKG